MSLARRWSFSLLLLLAAACKDQSTEAPASGAGGTATASGGGATIGAALSLTGAAASYGALQRAGIQAGVEQDGSDPPHVVPAHRVQRGGVARW